MLDLSLLRIMKHRQEFHKLYYGLPRQELDKTTLIILDDYKKYFDKFPEHDVIDMTVFIPRFKTWHKLLTDEQFAQYKAVLVRAQEDVDECTTIGVQQDILELSMASNLAELVSKFTQGNLKESLMYHVVSELDQFKLKSNAVSLDFDRSDINDLFVNEEDSEGLTWRLGCLNECMRPMIGGTFGIVAARPDQGKTSFMCSEVTYMAPQLPEGKTVVWLNNEGITKTIKARTVQAALGLNHSALVKLKQSADIADMYYNAIGGENKIKIFDITGMHIGQVEQILEDHNPGLIVFDMIDNIRGFSSEARKDQQLELLYQWGRERTKKYDCVGFATSQISADGHGDPYPPMSMLKDSRTGKQGANDFILMIGSLERPEYTKSRFLSLPKNKLGKDGCKRDPRCEVRFNPETSLYTDVPIGEVE